MSDENNELKNSLINMGLKEKEASVYLAILALGQGTASRIALKAHIARTTVYEVLSSLFDKGLVTLTGKEPKQEYVAESPDNFQIYIEKELGKIQKDFNNAKNILIPQLKSLHNVGNRPKVMFYEGKEGLEKVYEDTLTSHETIRAYANVDEMHEALPNYFPEYYKRRTNKGIHIRAIFPANQAGFERAKCDKNEARESALVPADKFYFSPEINIYDDKVMIASWKEKLGIIIESKEIADSMKKIFELAWSEAKRLHQEIA